MCLRPIHFTDEHFSSTSKTSSLGTTLKCRTYRIPKLLNIRLKEFCCILMMVKYPLLALLHSFLPTALSYGRWNTLLNICNCTAHSQQQLTQKCISHIKALHCLYEGYPENKFHLRILPLQRCGQDGAYVCQDCWFYGKAQTQFADIRMVFTHCAVCL